MGVLRYGQQELPLKFSNSFLAHLQVAAQQRFATGAGFYLTGTYPDPDGAEVTVSRWLHPTIPLEFVYDVTDDADARLAPVELDHGQIDAMLAAMERPVGVKATGDVWLAFTEPL
jgi:hypothetical protein